MPFSYRWMVIFLKGGITMKQYTNDLMIRKAMYNRLSNIQKYDPSTIIIPEVEICMGYSRADIMMVNGILHGFEIKSDRDTLERLKYQIGYYEQVFEKITIVTGEKFCSEIDKIVPGYWGIMEASFYKNGNIKLSNLRAAKKNPYIDEYSLIQLLWKDELLLELQLKGLDKGIKSKPRNFLAQFLVENTNKKELLDIVKNRLKLRENWRSYKLND